MVLASPCIPEKLDCTVFLLMPIFEQKTDRLFNKRGSLFPFNSECPRHFIQKIQRSHDMHIPFRGCVSFFMVSIVSNISKEIREQNYASDSVTNFVLLFFV